VQEIVSIDTQLERDPIARVDLNALLANILDAHRLRIASASTNASVSGKSNSSSSGRSNTGVRLQLDAPNGAALHVRASPERLAQVFDNLVDNAVSFSPANGLVTVTLARRNGQCHVTVADEGPGIPEAHLARVFERFFSYRPNNGGGNGNGSDSDRTPRDRHTGLGLSIARAIVESYGGSIEASNRATGGAHIDVLLPGA
jgi:two-component system, OmpR family, sensor histidine kinase ChvG